MVLHDENPPRRPDGGRVPASALAEAAAARAWRIPRTWGFSATGQTVRAGRARRPGVAARHPGRPPLGGASRPVLEARAVTDPLQYMVTPGAWCRPGTARGAGIVAGARLHSLRAP